MMMPKLFSVFLVFLSLSNIIASSEYGPLRDVDGKPIRFRSNYNIMSHLDLPEHSVGMSISPYGRRQCPANIIEMPVGSWGSVPISLWPVDDQEEIGGFITNTTKLTMMFPRGSTGCRGGDGVIQLSYRRDLRMPVLAAGPYFGGPSSEFTITLNEDPSGGYIIKGCMRGDWCSSIGMINYDGGDPLFTLTDDHHVKTPFLVQFSRAVFNEGSHRSETSI